MLEMNQTNNYITTIKHDSNINQANNMNLIEQNIEWGILGAKTHPYSLHGPPHKNWKNKPHSPCILVFGILFEPKQVSAHTIAFYTPIFGKDTLFSARPDF